MNPIWNDLLAKLALLIMVAAAWSQAERFLGPRSALLRQVALSGWFGFGVIFLMMNPVELSDGIFFDLRNAPIVLAGLFGGPFPAAFVGSVAAGYRASAGGVGMPAGLCSLAIVTGVAVVAGHRFQRTRLSRAGIVGAAAVASIGTTGGMFLLPRDLWAHVFTHAVPPNVAIGFVAITLVGFALLEDRRQRETSAENRMHRAIMDALPDCLNAKDLAGRFIVANPATAALMQAGNPDSLIGKTDFDFYSAAVATQLAQDDKRVIDLGANQSMDQNFVLPGGAQGWLSTLKTPFHNEAGDIIGIITHGRDVTAIRGMETDLKQVQRHLEEILAQIPDGVALFDRDQRLVFCNQQYSALFPLTADVRTPGATMIDIVRASAECGEEDVPAESAEAWIQAVRHVAWQSARRQVRLADGRWLETRWAATTEGGRLCVVTDVTLAKAAELSLMVSNERLGLDARTDSMTQLPNRRAFDLALSSEVARSRRRPIALLMLDVDHFKAFNDAYGHPAGDRCLGLVAECLRAVLAGTEGFAARYGGEEFATILMDADLTRAVRIGDRICAAVRALTIEHSSSASGVVTISVGVAVAFPGDALSAAELVAAADGALYAAKAAGRNTVRLAAGQERRTPTLA